MYRGLIHFHSCYSYDSLISMESIVSFALKNDINFLVLTDHDTFEGSLRLREYVADRNIDIDVILAAEYNTNYGDVIALGISSEILNRDFDLFVAEVRSQGGYILFPHPFVGHKNIEKIAEKSDLIEVFNSRVSSNLNACALALAEKYDKPVYFSSDAHLRSELKNSIIEFEIQGDFVSSLLASNVVRVSALTTKKWKIIYSQLIKSFKTRNLKLFINNFICIVRGFSQLRNSV